MQLHVEERGHGPVRIALLHGFLGAGRLFWGMPGLARMLARACDRTDAAVGPANAAIVEAAHRSWDRSMVAELLHDVAVHPVAAAAPVVPSALVLSDQGGLVVPSADVSRRAALGWDVVRMEGIRHDMPLLDGARTARGIDDAIRPSGLPS